MSKVETTEILLQKRFLTTAELFNEFGFSESNQAKMRMKRVIPFVKINRYIRYDRLEINKWLESNKVEVAS